MNHEVPRVSVIIPTYNEVDNVGQLIGEIHGALQGMDYQIVVVDDNSPDGTYFAAKQIAERDSRVLALCRPSKLGLASAVLHGFKASNGNLVVMMDSDLSHRPHDLRNLLSVAGCADIVIGSRYVKGGSIVGMSPYRQLASRTSIWISRKMLGLHVRDTTSGFVVFRREVLDSLAPKAKSTGFKLLLEVLVKHPKAQIKEVPITFFNRRRGKSKFGVGEVVQFLRLCHSLRRYRRWAKEIVE